MAIEIIQQNTDATAGWVHIQSFYPNGSMGNSGVAESFTPTKSFKLTSVTVLMRKLGSPTGNLQAVLFASNDGGGDNGRHRVTGEILASGSKVDMSTLTTDSGGAEVTFTFSGVNQYNLLPNVRYFFAVIAVDAGSLGSTAYVSFRFAEDNFVDENPCFHSISVPWGNEVSPELYHIVYGMPVGGGGGSVSLGRPAIPLGPFEETQKVQIQNENKINDWVEEQLRNM